MPEMLRATVQRFSTTDEPPLKYTSCKWTPVNVFSLTSLSRGRYLFRVGVRSYIDLPCRRTTNDIKTKYSESSFVVHDLSKKWK